MKTVFLFVCGCFACLPNQAQIPKKIPVENTGCTIYSYCTFQFENEYSEDSSKLTVSECASGDLNFGIICVQLKQIQSDPDKAESSLIEYLNYLKKTFNILKSAGYGKGHRLANNETTRGVLDYWEDGDKNNWKVKGWTNGKFITVLYVYAKTDLPETKINVFLDGFRFPVL
jgi:hypothetical protein